eukprot:406044_1
MKRMDYQRKPSQTALLKRSSTNYARSLDVALSEIHALFCYATRDLYQLFPDFVVATSMGYHKFFFHFLMFGCLLGKLDRKHMALDRHKMNDNDYRSNDVLRYCIDKFLANIGKSNMNYKYCDSRRINHECISHKSVSRESTKPFVNKGPAQNYMIKSGGWVL